MMKLPPTIADVLVSLRPGAIWSCADTYESIQWMDEVQTQPTEAEVNAELQRLQDLYVYTEYQRLRAKAYPSLEDQMDTLFHFGYDGWKAQIQQIKDQYPKPAE